HGRDRRGARHVPRAAHHGTARGVDARAAGPAVRRLPRAPSAAHRGAPGSHRTVRERPHPELPLQQHARLLHRPGGGLRRPATGRINPESDRRLLDPVARADIEPLVRLTHAEIERDGGNGGQEIRNWVALLGAVPGWKGEVLAYEPVAEWITGCATVWVHP